MNLLTHPKVVGVVACLAMVSQPTRGATQVVDLEGRVAAVVHGATGCMQTRATGFSPGVAIRTRGRWIASGAVDVFSGRDEVCEASLPVVMYGGQVAEVWGSSRFASPRGSIALGIAHSAAQLRYEVMIGVGAVRTKTTYGAAGSVVRWHPWQGLALTIRPRGSDVGMQFEVGRHRLRERFYAMGQSALLLEHLRWEPLFRMGLTLPILDW